MIIPPSPVRVVRWATGSSSTVCFGPTGDEPPALDRQAVCSRCGATGTVAFVMREVDPPLSRYCAGCWREVRNTYWSFTAQWDLDTPEGKIAFHDHLFRVMRERPICAGSALWEDRLEFVRAARASAANQGSDANGDRYGAQLARELLEHAPEMDGPIPPEIEAYVREFGSS